MSQATQPPLPTKQYMDDFEWIKNHLDELAATHPDEWVAVHKGRVLAAGPGLTQVKTAAEAQVSATDIAYYYVDTGTLIL
jgi:hypothetical protein